MSSVRKYSSITVIGGAERDLECNAVSQSSRVKENKIEWNEIDLNGLG